MSAFVIRVSSIAAVLCCAAGPVTWAGHEVPYYPSFYPQEIRIETLDPQAAGREFANARDPLHAYIGTAPRFSGAAPADLKSVVSLRSFITASANPQRLTSRDTRCRAATAAAAMLAKHPDLVTHAYPITPYHADYINHVDRVPEAASGVAAGAPIPSLQVRAGEAITPLTPENFQLASAAWDISIEEVPVGEVTRRAGAGTAAWPTAPWLKEGWFQAYHLLRPALSAPEDGRRADDAYRLLVDVDARNPAERINRERALLAALMQGCDRVVVGYRLRREVHNDEFSNGVENISFDSQSGLNSPVAMRTIKLKDLPWNGWLRLGIEDRPAAAWNPVAGFSDAPGRLVWSAIGDDSFLPIPYNSLWATNRAEIFPHETPPPRQSIRLPADAITVDPATGRLVTGAADANAMTKVTYRISASVFHDGTAMEVADFVFPYALAFRWGGAAPGSAIFDAEIEAATALLRQRLKGVRLVRVEETKLPIADLVFEYRWPIVEVYLDTISSNERDNALIAPPWSSVPWHVLALMEAAVERGIAAFSRTESERRRLPWLDLLRDLAQRETLRGLIKEFAQTSYRPAALASLVDPEAAKARWEALDKFVETTGHLLVTNGPYKIRSVTPEVTTLDVIREFTYPIGIGTFDFHAYPAKALINRVERIGSRILVSTDAEIAVKQQRDRRITVAPLKRDTLRGMQPIQPVSRYIVVAEDGKVAASGSASREPDGRFAAALPALPPGNYRFFGAILLDGNAFNPTIGRIEFRVN